MELAAWFVLDLVVPDSNIIMPNNNKRIHGDDMLCQEDGGAGD